MFTNQVIDQCKNIRPAADELMWLPGLAKVNLLAEATIIRCLADSSFMAQRGAQRISLDTNSINRVAELFVDITSNELIRICHDLFKVHTQNCFLPITLACTANKLLPDGIAVPLLNMAKNLMPGASKIALSMLILAHIPSASNLSAADANYFNSMWNNYNIV
jgi:hypothetical protein